MRATTTPRARADRRARAPPRERVRDGETARDSSTRVVGVRRGVELDVERSRAKRARDERRRRAVVRGGELLRGSLRHEGRRRARDAERAGVEPECSKFEWAHERRGEASEGGDATGKRRTRNEE